MKELTRAEFDAVMHSGADLILFFYKEENAYSTLGLETMKEIDQLLGKSFLLFLVNIDAEPEISEVFDIQSMPQYVSMKNCKIFKRSSELLSTSQVLELLK